MTKLIGLMTLLILSMLHFGALTTDIIIQAARGSYLYLVESGLKSNRGHQKVCKLVRFKAS